MIGLLLLAVFSTAMAEADDRACAGAEPQLDAAARALEARDFRKAQEILDPLEAGHPMCPALLVTLGRAWQGQGEFRKADTLSELAAAFAPENPAALVFRGEMLSLRGAMPQAQVLLEKACDLEPANASAHFELGMIFDRTRRQPQAVAEFRKVLELKPSNPRAWDYLALNLEPLGDTAGAETSYQKGLAVNAGPDFDAFLDYNYGKFLMKLNRLEESRRHLDKAVQLAPKVRAVHYDRAKLSLRLGELEDARRDAERALSLPDPGGFILDLQVYSLLASIYTRLGQKELAQKYIDLAQQASVPMRSRDRK